jgi:hypothetical protein
MAIMIEPTIAIKAEDRQVTIYVIGALAPADPGEDI